MKIKAILSALFALTFIFAVKAFADESSVNLIPYDNFESYTGRTGSPWSAQGAATFAPIEQTDRGNSAVLVSSKGAMQELFVNTAKTDASIKTVITGFSLKLCDLKTKRAYFLRCDSAEIPIMEISSSGVATLCGTALCTLSVDKWYDFVVEYNMVTGFVRAKCDDGQTQYIAESQCSTKGISGIWRVNLVSWGTAEGEAAAYIDNCWSYALSYDAKEYAKGEDIADFEDFVPSGNGQTGPAGWTLQNKAVGATFAGVKEFEGYGKALELSSNGTTHYQVIYGFGSKSDNEIIAEFDFRMQPSSFITFGLRGKNSGGALTRDNFPIAVSSSGAVTLSGAQAGALLADKWYHVTLTLDIPSQTYTVSFVSDEDTLEGTGTIPGDVRVLNGIDFYFPPGGGRASTVYLDNIDIFASKVAGIKGFEPALGKISAGETTISVEIDGAFSADAVAAAIVKINGDKSKVLSKEKNGSKILVTFDASEYDSGYFVEITDLVCEDGTVLSAASGYFSLSKWTISDFKFSKQSISSGNTGVSATITSRSDELTNATLVLALYSKSTGEMLGITFDACSISEGSSESLQCSLSVPEKDDEYELIAYMWDGFDGMKILGMSKILN